MKALNFIIENWYFIVTAIVMIAMAIIITVNFFNLPAKEQTEKVKEWLLYAVTEAEKQLGGGTGQLKLRQVYDLFVQRFPAVALAVSFETFSLWVDEALEQMRNMLAQNEQAAAYVESGVLAQGILEGVEIDG
ncbi:hypothetical protein H9X85_10700 [Anaerotignum lactatifermentans]|uniref:Uncharacterized protein n=1 Tax=Anaerotignum lactatifermentans TaxID=160404 RepID=A0ABS2GAV3_9FIRM|nr:hypothetical protein [Anaerotignum lactatifermentans]MBM6830029.1 hypothetical protein [Anaerotignum lactatifermentans]MBM6878621.1 hypothetical protein [Anaerotignum lactatifermentans]MBM6951666.1 hypothetical protein [Anaerotignum lactatifermentans]